MDTNYCCILHNITVYISYQLVQVGRIGWMVDGIIEKYVFVSHRLWVKILGSK